MVRFRSSITGNISTSPPRDVAPTLGVCGVPFGLETNVAWTGRAGGRWCVAQAVPALYSLPSELLMAPRSFGCLGSLLGGAGGARLPSILFGQRVCFRELPQIPRHREFRPYAAGADAASPWNFTLTSRDTPGSCIVTPYNAAAASMVRLECVITMNCVCADISFTRFVRRPMLDSSSGASTSSITQNGLG